LNKRRAETAMAPAEPHICDASSGERDASNPSPATAHRRRPSAPSPVSFRLVQRFCDRANVEDARKLRAPA